MTNSHHQNAINHLAQRLTNGLPHPGNPTTGQPAKLLLLPGMQSTGIPPEMAAQFATDAGLPTNDAPQIIAEAIVNTLTTESGLELIPRAELHQLRAQLAEPTPDNGQQIAIHCRCNPREPLLIITGNRSQIPIDAPALQQRITTACTCQQPTT